MKNIINGRKNIADFVETYDWSQDNSKPETQKLVKFFGAPLDDASTASSGTVYAYTVLKKMKNILEPFHELTMELQKKDATMSTAFEKYMICIYSLYKTDEDSSISKLIKANLLRTSSQKDSS